MDANRVVMPCFMWAGVVAYGLLAWFVYEMVARMLG